jgi:hypothetical protein
VSAPSEVGAAVLRWSLIPALTLLIVSPGVVEATCEPVSAYQQLVTPTPASETTLSVTLVIHLMERPGHDCEAREAWTSDRLATLLGPDPQDASAVSSVWGSTRIRFIVREVALHQYTPKPALVDQAGDVQIPTTGPLGAQPWESAFTHLVRRFHRAGSINVYLWKTVAPNQAGFGRSTRSGRGKASVWLASKCVDPNHPQGMTPQHCARVGAHELGHALGLYHPGSGRCASVQPRYRKICMRVTEPCGESDNGERLMASGGTGRKLCLVEVVGAEYMATELE